ncbi:MAG TPA: type I phosphomannose isomerase catalytic subunit [Verrucomicrobiae bacterium]|nr:type I phosphomannose isomerase catalytic subunit [Verrucomicrobiae bacterium]
MLYPFTFHPVLKERVWGGRKLGQLYHKELPAQNPVGESWEITDRPEGVSVIANGPLAGKDLRWLMEHHAEELLGEAPKANGRFPWLVKILDARQVLSLQVHPPAGIARELGGEPKTEMWFVTEADEGAEILAGLKPGVEREEFRRKAEDGSVAECFHRLPVRMGDVMFLPSGRVHALGAGLVIFEIQQNSDTTYRVFDWNRRGLDGRPRELHLEQSMRCIDFGDIEPGLVSSQVTMAGPIGNRALVRHHLFHIDEWTASEATSLPARKEGALQVFGVVAGGLTVAAANEQVYLAPGQFCLLPASLERVSLRTAPSSRFLSVLPG